MHVVTHIDQIIFRLPNTLPSTRAAARRQKIAVCMQERQAILDAPGRDQRVDGLPDRDPHGPQRPVVLRCFDRKLVAGQVDVLESVQRLLNPLELSLVPNTLQHLGGDRVPNRERTAPELRIQKSYLRRVGRPEIVDSENGIDQDHRSVRIAFKSPSQVISPFSSRAFSCARSCTNVFRPSSTAWRFVFAPVTFKACFMSLSSISMFIRTLCASLSAGKRRVSCPEGRLR